MSFYLCLKGSINISYRSGLLAANAQVLFRCLAFSFILKVLPDTEFLVNSFFLSSVHDFYEK